MKSIEDLLLEFIAEGSKVQNSKEYKESGDFGQLLLMQGLFKSTADKIRDQFKGSEAPRTL